MYYGVKLFNRRRRRVSVSLYGLNHAVVFVNRERYVRWTSKQSMAFPTTVSICSRHKEHQEKNSVQPYT